jgi:hypothetical protein
VTGFGHGSDNGGASEVAVYGGQVLPDRRMCRPQVDDQTCCTSSELAGSAFIGDDRRQARLDLAENLINSCLSLCITGERITSSARTRGTHVARRPSIVARWEGALSYAAPAVVRHAAASNRKPPIGFVHPEKQPIAGAV